LLEKHLNELTYLCAQENGKKWDEALGDVLKVIEVVEFACGAPHIMKGESLMKVSTITTPSAITSLWVCLPALRPGTSRR
jgi:acyl-CoA reductase-like NAD-dependent aldehyde dehydrogenase